jgi:hypothetical protein
MNYEILKEMYKCTQNHRNGFLKWSCWIDQLVLSPFCGFSVCAGGRGRKMSSKN